ncbi:MAG: beta-hexosaminidase [Oscillospiraceae bacterium]|nr:beta-hexosaminidase [Oscillospiraceae bacterium]
MKRLALILALLLTLTACGEAPQEDLAEALAPEVAEEVEAMPEPIPEPQPTPEELYITDKLASMTLEQKVGQLFFVRCPELYAAEDVANYHLGGVLLFGRDFKDKSYEEVTGNIESYQIAAEIPLFIGVDEEGGTVCRVSSQKQFRSSRFKAPQKLYQAGGLDAVLAEDAERNALLRSFGINVNFAPVADISTNPNDFIYDRTLGLDAATTAEVTKAVVTQMNAQNIASVLKHFPGYGSNVDTHTGIAVDERSLDSFRESDFLPFAAGIGAGSPFVLVSHNIITAVDASLPASLSPAVHNILREELSFDGIILTDDLAMEAVEAYAADGSVAVLAALAGNDMIVTSDYRTQIPLVIDAVHLGILSEDAIDASLTRILQTKIALGLIHIN